MLILLSCPYNTYHFRMTLISSELQDSYNGHPTHLCCQRWDNSSFISKCQLLRFLCVRFLWFLFIPTISRKLITTWKSIDLIPKHALVLRLHFFIMLITIIFGLSRKTKNLLCTLIIAPINFAILSYGIINNVLLIIYLGFT